MDQKFEKELKEKFRPIFEVFGKAVVGDFSGKVDIPDEEGVISDIYNGVEVLLGVVNEKIKEEEEIKRALEEEISGKDKFLAVLSHELRNPLSPIVSSIEAMRMKKIEDRELKDSVDLIDRQVQNIVRLLGDLLDVSRIKYGKIQLQKKPSELRSLIQNAIETARPFIKEHELDLKIFLPEETIPMYADAFRIEQAVVNLLNNAAKFTSAGGVINVSLSKKAGEARICVRDNGIGIEQAELEKIFNPFQQAADSFGEKNKGGLGIGLALVKSLVELHGGSISAYSKGKGQGSEFEIYLPIMERNNNNN